MRTATRTLILTLGVAAFAAVMAAPSARHIVTPAEAANCNSANSPCAKAYARCYKNTGGNATLCEERRDRCVRKCLSQRGVSVN